MLEPNYLQNVGDDLEKLYQELATEILVDIAERIKMNQDAMTSTTEYLNNKLKQLGLQQDWINKRLAEILHTSEEEVDRIMQQSAYKSIRDTFDRLEAGGYDTSGLEFSDQIKKGTSALWGDIQNLTRTTAQLASDTFMRYYDMAYLQVSSGAYSLDQATANTIDKLCREGLTKVSYPSGAQRSIEAAVRLAVRTAVNQNALACEKSVIDELDINLVQTSAHMGARPSHAAWQGKVFWVNYPEGNYENFYEATGYGTGAGLGGWNCRHSFTAYFPGISEDYNKPVNPKENDRIYQMEQKQRSYERNMRKWDRERRVKAAAGLDTTKEDYWYKYNKMRLKELVDASNGYLKRDYSAEKIGGTKGRPYKPVRIPKKRVTYRETHKEESRRSIDGKTTIDRKYINSNEYRKKFGFLEEDRKTVIRVARESVNILKHRQGTLGEDLVYINPKDNKVLRNRSSQIEQETYATERMKKIVTDNLREIIAIHNHPKSGVPSFSDLSNAKRYKYGLVVCHNGLIFKYETQPEKILDEHAINMYLDTLEKSIYNDNREISIDTKELKRAQKRLENAGIKLEVIANDYT